MKYLLTLALCIAATSGIIEWGNFLNSRSPKVHAPLDRDAAWWIASTNAP